MSLDLHVLPKPPSGPSRCPCPCPQASLTLSHSKKHLHASGQAHTSLQTLQAFPGPI